MAFDNISDTAMWVAYYRSMEGERARPLFVDPFARDLAGERGKAMAHRMRGLGNGAAIMAVRTHVLDGWVREAVEKDGIDTVYDLAAGLDTRPYRLDLPKSLRWVDVDLAPILAYKEDKLKGATPRCRVERIAVDLADAKARAAFMAGATGKALVITEGLLPYLTAEAVAQFARELRQHPTFRFWAFDYVGWRALKHLQRRWNPELDRLRAPLIFPLPGGAWFDPCGWRVKDERAMLMEAKRLGRDRPMLKFARLVMRARGHGTEGAMARVFGGLALLAPA